MALGALTMFQWVDSIPLNICAASVRWDGLFKKPNSRGVWTVSGEGLEAGAEVNMIKKQCYGCEILKT